jgi:putative flippase GtrA
MNSAQRSLSSTLRQMCLFGFVGMTNTMLDIAAFTLLTQYLRIWAVTANVISFSLGAVSSYILNRHITFGMPHIRHGQAAEIARFALATAATLLISTISLALLIPIAGIMIAKFTSVLVSFGFSYTLQRKLVFRN